MASNTMVVNPTLQNHELEGVDQSSTLQIPDPMKYIGRKDIGNEEEDAGSPNGSDKEAKTTAPISRDETLTMIQVLPRTGDLEKRVSAAIPSSLWFRHVCLNPACLETFS
jgi:hypothetical protein